MTHEKFFEMLTGLFSTMAHEARVAFFSRVLSLFGPYVRDNGQFWLDIYEAAEKAGVHVLPVHYYSPVPETKAYPPDGVLPLLFEKNFGVDIPSKFQKDFYPKVCLLAEELRDVPLAATSGDEIHWNNNMFGVLDACVYYAMVRHFKPATVLEIGAGFSTLFACRGASKSGSTSIECVEPYPVEFFNRHLAKMEGIALTVQKVQDIPLERFANLRPNDILFIDSSHVVKSGSDTEYLIFRVLPVLPPGVIVHFHDIYLPYSYPRHNLEHHRRFWNENYVVGALLSNNSVWNVLISNCTLSTDENLRHLCDVLSDGDAAISDKLYMVGPGGSLWIQKS